MPEEHMNREQWIDVAKCLAILAVILNHTNDILYSRRLIAYFSYFNVSLFVLILGVTSYISYHNKKINTADWVKGKIRAIFVPYLFATLASVLVLNKFLDFNLFLNHIIRFDACGPYYYVILYIQLIIISPILFGIVSDAISKKQFILELFTMLVVIWISIITTNYTNILDIYGGGGRILGGTYLILFYFGILFAKYRKYIKRTPIGSLILMFACFLAAVLWLRYIYYDNFELDRYLNLGNGFNPPGVSIMVYAILILFVLFFSGLIIGDENKGLIGFIYRYMSRLGRHTLYIFLYHSLIIQSIVLNMASKGAFLGRLRYIKRLTCFALIICMPVLFEKLLGRIGAYLSDIYFGKAD